MTSWLARTADRRFGLQVDVAVLRELDRLCEAAGRSETGGILIGRYSDDCNVAIVLEATPPPIDSQRGRSWFVRGVSGLRELLGRKWRARERAHYLGEWHFHPVGHIQPSSDDFSQMSKIARTSEYDCKEPLLIILGTSRQGDMRALRAYVCPLAGRPLELLP